MTPEKAFLQYISLWNSKETTNYLVLQEIFYGELKVIEGNRYKAQHRVFGVLLFAFLALAVYKGKWAFTFMRTPLKLLESYLS